MRKCENTLVCRPYIIATSGEIFTAIHMWFIVPAGQICIS